MAQRVLLVEPERRSVLATQQVLIDGGYQVDVVSTFEQAVRELANQCPDLLVAAVRLGAFNGFHLALRSRALYPQLPSMVMGMPGDGQAEGDRLAITFASSPIDPPAFLATVSKLLAGRPPQTEPPQRRWPRKPAHVPAMVSDSSVEVVELSYGGMRLRATPLTVGVGHPLVVVFPSVGMSVDAVLRWSKTAEEGAACWCGAEVQTPDPGTGHRWRTFVDSVH